MSKPKALFLIHGSHARGPNSGRAVLEDVLRVQAGLDLKVADDYSDLTPARLALYDIIINYSGYKSRIEPNEAQLRALLAAVEGGRPYLPVHGAALMFRNQVYYRQPLGHLLSNPDPNDPLLALPNCVVLPHIASASEEARVALIMKAVENVEAVLAGRPPLNPVKP